MTILPAILRGEARRQQLLDRLDAERAELRREQIRQKRRERDRLIALERDRPDSLAAFARWSWPIIEPGKELTWNWHLDIIFDALQRQIMGEPEYRKLLIMVPPGTMKSLAVSVIAPAWEWLHDPTRQKLCIAGDDKLAVRDSRRTRLVIQNAEYRELAAEAARDRGEEPWALADDQNQKINFETSRRGFRQCLGIGAHITGKRGDDLTLDDLIDVKEIVRGTPEMVERRCAEVQTVVDTVLPTRVNSMARARWTLIMQRLHVSDPAGHALKEGDWHVICFPMRFEADHPHRHPQDPRTVEGELLFPALFPEDEVRKLEVKLDRAGKGQAAAQLQQRPGRVEGGAVRREFFRERYGCRPEDIAATADEVWATSDAAKKGNVNSDLHAIHVWARKDAKRYLLDRVAGRMTYPEYQQAMDGVIERWKPHIVRTGGGVLIEDQANGTTYLQMRRQMYWFLHDFQPTRDTPGKDKSKGARFIYLERAAEGRALVLPEPSVLPDVEAVVGQWCAFPAVANDDDCDAASQLLMRWALEQEQSQSMADLAQSFGFM